MLISLLLMLSFLQLMSVLYFLPAGIALARGHRHVASIAVLNLFLGWTFVGWAGALMWSLTGQRPAVQVNPEQDTRPYPVQPIWHPGR